MVHLGGWLLSFPQPQPPPSGCFTISPAGPQPSHFIGVSLSLRLSRFLNHRLFRSYLQDAWSRRPFLLQEFNLMNWSPDTVSSTPSLFYFDGGNGGKGARVEANKSSLGSSNGTPNGRQLTNVLLAMNVLLYIAQVATEGKLMLWGAKINSLISKGQLWRLITSAFLHANVGHLMVNCYSLNSVGPAVEAISGPQRFFTIYFSSAVASSATSYWMCKAPAVGASGAIFGLVGSFAVFVMRHRSLVGRGTEDLQQIARVIALNMVIGILSKGIDNWGHLGGLLGGVAMSWLIGPAWEFESITKDGRRVFSDRAPISRLLNKIKKTPTGLL